MLDLFACCLSRRPAFLPVGKAFRQRVLSCLARVHGEALLHKRVGTLSGGEVQRVLLALALEPMPHMLILDEPLSGVDVEGMTLLMDMLDEIRKTYDLSILMTTHDFSLWKNTATRWCSSSTRWWLRVAHRGLIVPEFAGCFTWEAAYEYLV